MHLLMDCAAGDMDTLHDIAMAEDYLSSLADRTDMTIIVPPVVRRTPDGLVGMLVLAESHASIHVIGPDAWIDLFTCNDLSREGAEGIREYTGRVYSFERIDARLVTRGLDTLGG